MKENRYNLAYTEKGIIFNDEKNENKKFKEIEITLNTRIDFINNNIKINRNHNIKFNK